MASALAVYVLLHSPLRDFVTRAFGLERRTCYFCLPQLPRVGVPDLTGVSVPDSLAAGALLILAALAAWALAERGSWPAYDRLIVLGIAWIALVAVPAAIVGGLASLLGGSYLRPPAGPLLAAIPSVVVLVLAARGGWRPSRPRLRLGLDTPLLRVAAAAAGLLLLAELVVTIVHPPSQGDALTYHAPLAVLFWSDGDLTSVLDRSPETWGLANPGTAELLYGALRVLGGERLANLGQLPFAALGAAATYAFTRRTGLLHGSAVLAACAFLLIPMAVLQVGTQANDLAGAGLVMAAAALASAPSRQWDLGRAASVGLALGLAAATKVALVPAVAGIGLFVIVALIRHPARHRLAALLAVLALALLLAVTPWWARNIAREGNPLYPQSLPVYGHGVDLGAGEDVDFDFAERRAAWPVYPLLEPIDDRSGFGALFAIALVPGLIAAIAGARRRPVLLYGSTLAWTLAFWWVYSHHEPRFLLAYAGLGVALVPWAILAVRRRRRPVAVAVVIAAALFSVAVTIDQQILPFGRQPVERAAFYDRVYGVDPAAQALPEGDGILIHTGYGLASIDYTSYYPLLGRSHEREVALLDAEDARGSRAAVIARMRERGTRYAYVQALPRFRDDVARLFRRPEFELVHRSAIVRGDRIGVRRTEYRPARGAEAREAVRRYLFRLAG
ncbi:MAG TPA: hypothetical protein VJT68_09040 [Thermoleophilaceae bacterium]|nr:hypothetical protein [Thermoleophilaceae bacterium]